MSDPTVIDSMPIANILAGVIGQVQEGIRICKDETMVVDLSVEIRQVSITKGGIPVFSPKTSEQSIEIKLALRVRAADLDSPIQPTIASSVSAGGGGEKTVVDQEKKPALDVSKPGRA